MKLSRHSCCDAQAVPVCICAMFGCPAYTEKGRVHKLWAHRWQQYANICCHLLGGSKASLCDDILGTFSACCCCLTDPCFCCIAAHPVCIMRFNVCACVTTGGTRGGSLPLAGSCSCGRLPSGRRLCQAWTVVCRLQG